MSANEQGHEEDVRVVVRNALFWRELLGEEEFQKFTPADLYRWYVAMDTMGHQSVRQLVDERTMRYPVTLLHGVVPCSPHPPVRLVRQWLEAKEKKFNRGWRWPFAPMVLFTVLAFIPWMYSCTYTVSPPYVVSHPQVTVAGQQTWAAPTMTSPSLATPGKNIGLLPGGGQGLVPPTQGTQPPLPAPSTAPTTPGGGVTPGGGTNPGGSAIPQNPNGAISPGPGG